MNDSEYLEYLNQNLEQLGRQTEGIYARGTFVLTANLAFGAALYSLVSPELLALRWRADAVAFWLTAASSAYWLAKSTSHLKNAILHKKYDEVDIAEMHEWRSRILKKSRNRSPSRYAKIRSGYIKNSAEACRVAQHQNAARYSSLGRSFRSTAVSAQFLLAAALLRLSSHLI